MWILFRVGTESTSIPRVEGKFSDIHKSHENGTYRWYLLEVTLLSRISKELQGFRTKSLRRSNCRSKKSSIHDQSLGTRQDLQVSDCRTR
ncbi:unnamed protein product [Sphagnum balticum]